jgi:death-on-curing protein
MSEIEYLTSDTIREIHEDQIVVYGGSPGVRDLGMLESAVFRPQSGYYKDLIEEAAALWESLSGNHPFVDGNKRTAVAAAYTFLKINGYEASDEAWSVAVDFISALYETNQFRFDRIEPWLRENVHAVDTGPEHKQ